MNPGRPKVRDLTGSMPRRRYDVISSGLGCPALEDKRCAYDERNEQNGFYRDVLHGGLLLGTSMFFEVDAE